ncbi:MAG: DUF2306 domain-containing protein [Acidimicrobiia bacterium]
METTPKRVPAAWGTVFFLIAVVLVFVVIRVVNDSSNLAAGVIPPKGEFDRRYAQQPVLAYAHIVPGVVYLVMAPFQISRRFRNNHLGLHRRMGRILVPTGVLTGVFAIIFGFFFSFGGFAEASASVIFGIYFILALLMAYRSVRAGDTVRHRRWMLRAFAVGLAVGTIRLWVALFEALGVLDFDEAFGLAFWLAFVIHAAAAELWLRWRPI